MMNERDFLTKEDYEEPQCLLDMYPEIHPIPRERVLDKLDRYLDAKDFKGAERHLDYWLQEAESGNDGRGKLTVLNEQIGFYRKTEREDEALTAVTAVLELLEREKLSDSVTAATTCLNAATAYKAFGKTEAALPLYEKAKTLYEKYLNPEDERLGGLYNNMAVTVADLGDYERAEQLYRLALEILSEKKDCRGEAAVTYCNLADLTAARIGLAEGERQIADYLEQAYALFRAPDLPRDGRYAFICEKCAPTFRYYGFFSYADTLMRCAEEFYERT